MYRIIGADHREYGPVSADQIRQWIQEGRVNTATLCQAEGVPGWRPIATFPEFGVPPHAAPPPTPPHVHAGAVTNTNAVWGFVCGLLSVFCCCAGPFVGAVGIILSSIALSQLNRNPMQKGRGFAIAGLILSIVGVIVGLGAGIIGSFPNHHQMRFHRNWNF
jgi:hypothetical protein